MTQLPRKSDAGRYDPTTIWLHWTTVGLIVVLWAIGQTADLLPDGSLRAGVWSIHVALGLVTALVLLTRIAWRAHFGRILPPADTGGLYAVAKATHCVLYLAAVWSCWASSMRPIAASICSAYGPCRSLGRVTPRSATASMNGMGSRPM